VVQLASTLRDRGRAAEAVDLLEAEVAAAPEDGLEDVRAAFLALAPSDTGRHEAAPRTALAALAPHPPRYQRAVRHSAAELDATPAAAPTAAAPTAAAPTGAAAAGATAAAVPGVRLRAYEPEDAAAMRAVFSVAVRRTAPSRYTEAQVRAWAPDEADLDRWHERRASARTVVAVDEGGVVGFADLTGEGELDLLVVHPGSARRGVATDLVADVVAEATARGLRRARRVGCGAPAGSAPPPPAGSASPQPAPVGRRPGGRSAPLPPPAP